MNAFRFISMTTIKRKPFHYLSFTVVTILFGLLSRTSYIPDWIYPYLGDALYAIMIFFILGVFFRETSSIRLFALTFFICSIIELLQLYQTDWIVALRSTRLGALILGSGFLWSDLLAYLTGSFLIFTMENFIVKSRQ